MLMLCCDDDDDGHHRECHSTRVWIIHTPWHLQAIMSPLLYNIYNNKWHFYAPTLVNIWHKLAISSQLKPSDESLSHWRWSVQQLVQSINQSVKRKSVTDQMLQIVDTKYSLVFCCTSASCLLSCSSFSPRLNKPFHISLMDLDHRAHPVSLAPSILFSGVKSSRQIWSCWEMRTHELGLVCLHTKIYHL